MDCADESKIIEKKMKSLKGIMNFDINLMTQQIKIFYDPFLISIQEIIKAIAETGMKASIERPFISAHLWVPKQSINLIYGLAILFGIYYPAKMGFLALKTLTFNIPLLITVGAIIVT